jgi:two-component system, LytTR family, response regulator
MQVMRTLIVDDEPIARAGLRKLLAAHADFVVVGECRNGREAIQALSKQAIDLVFLDVQMPQLSGFDVIAAIGAGALPAVIFVTAYDQYAIQAFEVDAADYLLKPFDEERFEKTLARVRKHFQRGETQSLNERLTALLKRLDKAETAPPPNNRLVVKSAGRIQFVNVEELDWIEAAGNYIKLHVGGTEHLLRETMDAMAARLPAAQFFRIRRAVIVNAERIREMQPLFKGEYLILLRDGTELTSSRRYRTQLDALLGQSA